MDITSFASLILPQFPAQAIMAYEQDLWDVPFVVIRQNAESHKTIVWACSPGARAEGLGAGMPVLQAKKIVPKLLIKRQNPELERIITDEIRECAVEYTPEFTVGSSGTACLNLTGTPAQRSGDIEGEIERLRETIKRRTNVYHVAAGVARTRVIARMLASAASPDSVEICPPEREADMFGTMETSHLPSLSPQCRGKLKKYGLRVVAQVQRLSKEDLVRRLGHEGERLYCMVHGIEPRTTGTPPIELEAETTLTNDINDLEELIHHVQYTVDKLCFQVKSQHMRLGGIVCMIRYTDTRRAQKSGWFSEPTHDFLTISGMAGRLFEQAYTRRVAIKSIKLIGKRVCMETGQLNLFETVWENKQARLSESISKVREKMPFDSVKSAVHVKME